MPKTCAAVWLAFYVIAVCFVPSVSAAEGAKLRVGISPFVPFVITGPRAAASERQHGNGTPPVLEDAAGPRDTGSEPEGFCIDVWREIARQMGVEYEFVPSAGVAEKLQMLQDGKTDVAIGGISITKRREEMVDFTHPTFHSGLDILVLQGRGVGVWAKLKVLITKTRLTILIGFIALILVAAHLIWGIERSEDSAFGKPYAHGVLEGIYWAVVTASTVGYGDKVPRKGVGKVLAVLVIIVALPLFALFTAELASAFTVQRLATAIAGPEDLPGKRVGVVQGTTSADYVTRLHVGLYPYGRIDDAYAALARGEIDAVVYDAPALQYYAHHAGKGKVAVVGSPFMPQDFAIAVGEGSPLREQINRAILALIERREINRIHVKWFGEEKR